MSTKPDLSLPLAAVAQKVGGEVVGDDTTMIAGAAGFDHAQATQITFAEKPALLKRLDQTAAAAVLVPKTVDQAPKPIVRVEFPRAAYARLARYFDPPRRPLPGIDPRSVIAEGFGAGQDVTIAPGVVIGRDVTLGNRVILHPNVVLGDGVRIGDDSQIFPNATVLGGCIIGQRVVIHAGTVIGSDGFGFAPEGESYVKVPQRGIVQIDDDVEIGANNTIDRATAGKTWIKSGVKTDNLVHVAHNVTVGENALLVAHVGISGSSRIGRHAILAGQVGVADHVTIGDNVVIGAQSGVGKDIPAGRVVFGSPALPYREWLKVQTITPRLPQLKKSVAALEKRVQILEENNAKP